MTWPNACAAIAAKGQACVVLSGGRSPVPFLERLAVESLDWTKVTVSLADERWVPVENTLTAMPGCWPATCSRARRQGPLRRALSAGR